MNKESRRSRRNTWLATGEGPILIAGPCSAETEEQLLNTARQLAATKKVDYIRAGIWKPRTRPGSFEGVGVKALPWLQKVKEETKLPVTVEVAKASHVELCLEFGIDMLWIGARTSVNPFAVQEIADALRGTDIPVMVKNPINADLALWQGATERFIRSGLKRVGAIHRGFSNLGETVYRNRPQWQLAIKYKNEMPEIPLICDPSHICGRRDLLHKVSQHALDLDYDGLMVESHEDPDSAWSDAKQQITPTTLDQMIKKMVIRENVLNEEHAQTELDSLREQIDHIDDELLGLLVNRMNISRNIGEFKKENNLTILQRSRWKEVVAKGKVFATENEISEAFITKHLMNIHEESINQQKRIIQG